jgi:hypothetical protein
MNIIDVDFWVGHMKISESLQQIVWSWRLVSNKNLVPTVDKLLIRVQLWDD